MSSIHHWAQSGRSLPVEVGLDPSEGLSFSWSGIKLVVDLEIDITSERKENGEIVGKIVSETWGAGHAVQQSKDREDGTTYELSSTKESISLQHEIDPIKGPLPNQANDEKNCNKHQIIDVDGECGSKLPENSCTKNCTPCTGPCTWPEWGPPLPPEDLDDDFDRYCACEADKTHISKKTVTFSNVVTFLEPRSLQEERETGSFSYAGSSDDELEQGTDQVTSNSDANPSDFPLIPVSPSSEKESLDSADVSAASHLLELGNESSCGYSTRYWNENCLASSGISRRQKCEFYNPSNDLERLSKLVEKIYTALPQMSSISGSQGSLSNQEGRYWTIEVLKDSGRDSGKVRMKRVKCKKGEYNGLFGVHHFDDEIEVLERPPWKRQYKSLRNSSNVFSRCTYPSVKITILVQDKSQPAFVGPFYHSDC